MSNAKTESDVARMDLETWAVLSATVEHFPAERRGEVLERLGHAKGAWRRLQLSGHVALFRSVDAGDVEAVAGYGRALDATRRRLAADNPAVEDLGPLPGDAPPATPLAATRGALSAPAPEADVEEEATPTRRSGFSIVAQSSPTSPDAPKDRAHPVLTLQQYACLRAEIVDARDGAAIKRIHHCYGLCPASDAEESRAWGDRFFADRALFGKYKTLFDYYRAVLARRCG